MWSWRTGWVAKERPRQVPGTYQQTYPSREGWSLTRNRDRSDRRRAEHMRAVAGCVARQESPAGGSSPDTDCAKLPRHRHSPARSLAWPIGVADRRPRTSRPSRARRTASAGCGRAHRGTWANVGAHGPTSTDPRSATGIIRESRPRAEVRLGGLAKTSCSSARASEGLQPSAGGILALKRSRLAGSSRRLS